jgi:hypothetical protein
MQLSAWLLVEGLQGAVPYRQKGLEQLPVQGLEQLPVLCTLLQGKKQSQRYI